MIRKSIFALATVATIAATALVPTEAAAKSYKGGKYFGRFAIGTALIIGTAVAVNASCWRWAQTPSGRWVQVWDCN